MSNKNTNQPDILWYELTQEEVLSKLNTSINGLANEEVYSRRKIYGENKLPTKKAPSILKIFINQFLNPLIYILLFAAAISFIIGDKHDSFFISLVLLINAVVGTFQEWKAEKSAESLQKLVKVFATVKRDGKKEKIHSETLVPGDIVFLESGSKIPADIRLLNSNNLKVDESLLTGESVPVEKSERDLKKEDLPLAERLNMVYAGSVVVSGRGVGVVAETGSRIEIGKIAEAVTSFEGTKPPLVHRMEKFSRDISYAVLFVCIFIVLIEVLRGKNFLDTFFIITALAVSSIPEGLPAAMTVALSVGTNRMSKRNVIIKKLTAVEGLGSCTCIASDKTGTLTVNQQTVRLVSLCCDRQFSVTGEGYSGEGKLYDKSNQEIHPGENRDLDLLIRTAVIANEGTLAKKGEEWVGHGDEIDVSILALGFKYDLNYADIEKSIEVVHDIPYESDRAYSAKFYRENGQLKLATKGALEVLLPLSNKMVNKNTEMNISREDLEQRALHLAEKGYRIISVAAKVVEEEKPYYTHYDIHSLTFLGLICLIDPLRPESVDAIRECKEAGIKVVMVTGDHPVTALAIARDLEIAVTKQNLLTGKELSSMDIYELNENVDKISVFARVTPIQKLNIVDALIRAGHYVAVTGDGVNDAPALKKANIGIAMGSAVDVTKDVASIIVIDNNFASIVAGVEEGRFTYSNIRKVIYLLVSTGLAEILLFLFALILNMPLPLVAVQLLWLNLVTNGIQSVSFAFDKGEKGVMRKPPRIPTEGIFNKLMAYENIVSALTMSGIAFAVWLILLKSGYSEYVARNHILLLMVLFENYQALNCRSECVSTFKIPLSNNWLLIAGIILAQLVHLWAMNNPIMQSVLRIEPVSFKTWLIYLLLTLSLLIVMEIFKLFNNCNNKSKPK